MAIKKTPSDFLAYVIDFRDSSNCSRIESAQPGEEIQVLVHPEQDGAWFIVEITTADGKQQSFEWEYPLLKLVTQVLRPIPWQD